MRVAIAASVMLASCGPQVVTSKQVTRAEFEAAGLLWPFTVDSGTLGCDTPARWFETPDGTRYGINGFGQSRYQPAEPIWAVDKKMMAELKAAGAGDEPLLRINIGDAISEAGKLCDPPEDL